MVHYDHSSAPGQALWYWAWYDPTPYAMIFYADGGSKRLL